MSKRHQEKPRKLKWSKVEIEPMVMDYRAGMKRKEISEKYNIKPEVFGVKMTQYNHGELS